MLSRIEKTEIFLVAVSVLQRPEPSIVDTDVSHGEPDRYQTPVLLRFILCINSFEIYLDDVNK